MAACSSELIGNKQLARLSSYPHMAVNLSSSSNSSHSLNFDCLHSPHVNLTLSASLITETLLLLPLSIFILNLGVRRWGSKTTIHADVFTYHMVAMELIGVCGSVYAFCGLHIGSLRVMKLGFYIFCIILPGHSFLHVLTCVERYLAVVHPIMYRGLRNTGGVRIRNICIGCVWLLGLVWVCVMFRLSKFPTIPFLCLFALTFLVVCFCSLSVLCALRQPGPGGVGRDSRSKKRAFQTIMAIMVVLLFKFGGLLVYTGIILKMRRNTDWCDLLMSAIWLSLPGSLVLPLLFLHRVGKLMCCRNKSVEKTG